MNIHWFLFSSKEHSRALYYFRQYYT